MTAFFAKIGQWIAAAFAKYIIEGLKSLIVAYIKRREAEAKKKKQEKAKKKYDETLKTGNSDDIRKATDELLND